MSSDDQTRSCKFFRYVDRCDALTEQLPKASLARLTCFDVSKNYFACGCDSGAILLYNRRVQKSSTPLNSNEKSPVTCIKLLSNNFDLLAVGYKSSRLLLIHLPTGKADFTRQLKQSFVDVHRGHAIRQIEWSSDGRKVFTADDDGTVIATVVDFINDYFQASFICRETDVILQLLSVADQLFVCSLNHVVGYHLIPVTKIRFEIANGDEKLLGMCSLSNEVGISLYVLSANGIIRSYSIDNDEAAVIHMSSKLVDDDLSNAMETNKISNRCLATSRLYVNNSDGLISLLKVTILFLSIKDCGIQLMETKDLNDICHGDENEILGFVVDQNAINPTFFILNSSSHIHRFSGNQAPVSLTESHEVAEEISIRALISSLQKTTKLLPILPTSSLLSRLKLSNESVAVPMMNSLSNSNLDSIDSSEDFTKIESVCIAPPEEIKFLQNDGDHKINDNVVTHENIDEASDKNDSEVGHHGIIESVHKTAKKWVDTVGSFGTQPDFGFYAPDDEQISQNMLQSKNESPMEQVGIVENVAVHRINKGTKVRRLKNKDIDLQTSISSFSEFHDEASPVDVDEKTLENIRDVLTKITPMEPSSQMDHSVSQDSENSMTESNASHASEEANDVSCVQSLNSLTDSVVSDESDSERSDSATQKSLNDVGDGEYNAFDRLMKSVVQNTNIQPAVQSSDDTDSFHLLHLIDENVLSTNQIDIWSEIQLPYSCESFSVANELLVICHSKKRKRPRYLSKLSDAKQQWVTLKRKAEKLVLNDSGTLVWLIHKRVAYAPKYTFKLSVWPVTQWDNVANEDGGVVQVALTNDAAWYIAKSGQTYVQLRLPSMGILSKCESPWPLQSIAACEVAVWAIQSNTGRLVVRAGLRHSPIGIDWVEVIPEGPKRLVSIALHKQAGWAIDETKSLWFTNGIGYQSPFGTSEAWMRVCCPWELLPDTTNIRLLPWSVRVSTSGVFICTGRKIFRSSSLIVGHQFMRVVPDKLVLTDTFESISAGAISESQDSLIACRSNEIYVFRVRNSYFYSLPTFPTSYVSGIIDFCSFDSSVFLLDKSGCIYVKNDICVNSPYGSEWKLFDTGACGAPITSIAVTEVSIWVVTSEGDVLLFTRTNASQPLIGTNSRWIMVKKPVGCINNKICASSSGNRVWLYCKATGRSWARSNVCPERPHGRDWIEAKASPGVSDLAVGNKVVWSLSPSGQLHRLRGLLVDNPAGNYWTPIPVVLNAIAIDRIDHLWGIDSDKRLVLHKMDTYPPNSDRCIDDIN